MEGRLQRRYAQLVREHMHAAQTVAAGLSALPGVNRAFASTQAAWRFYANDSVTLPKLIEPLRAAGRQALQRQDQGAATGPDSRVLLVHDWCKLNYSAHTSKTDQVQLSNSRDIGYELYTALLVDADRGTPLCPMEQELKAAGGVHTTRHTRRAQPQHPLDQILPTMQASQRWDLGRQIVHVIDREADSLFHWRKWTQHGHQFLVRIRDDRGVQWNGCGWKVPQIAQKLWQDGAFRETRRVEFHGKSARQFVAEAPVTLHKPGRRLLPDGRRQSIPGPPLTLRLVIARVCDEDGRILAEWLLLTNVPEAVSAGRLALWYYWRWRIESYHKLLKSAGQQVEYWQQESAAAIAKRLLVASMACVSVWLLARQQTPLAQECQRVLVRLSGRQMKRSRPVTEPALLAGLERLLAVLDLLEHYTIGDLRRIMHQTIPFLTDSG